MTIGLQAAISAVIANGAQNSTAFFVGDATHGSFLCPGTVSSASITVQVSNDNSNFVALENAAGTAVAVVPISANESCMLPSETFNYRWARLRSASAEGAERTLSVYLKSVG